MCWVGCEIMGWRDVHGAPSILNTKVTAASSPAASLITTSPSPRVAPPTSLLDNGVPTPRDLDELAESASHASFGVFLGCGEDRSFSAPLFLGVFTIFGWAENASEVSGKPRRQS